MMLWLKDLYACSLLMKIKPFSHPQIWSHNVWGCLTKSWARSWTQISSVLTPSRVVNLKTLSCTEEIPLGATLNHRVTLSRAARRHHRFREQTLAGITKKVLKFPVAWRFKKLPERVFFFLHPKMSLMSCGVLNVKVHIYVAWSLLDYHGNWGSMLEVSGRRRDLDEPCECGGRDGESEGESDRGSGSRWRKIRRDAQRSSFYFSFLPLAEMFALLSTNFTPFFLALVSRSPPNGKSKWAIKSVRNPC